MYSRVYIEITNICNMHCSFCHGHSRQGRFMARSEFEHILKEIDGKTRYVYYHLMGEPLLHPELPLFIKATKERGLIPVITTNGTLLKKRGEELISSGVHKISVSLHSFEENDFTAQERYLKEVADFADAASKEGIIVVLRLWNKGFDEGRNDRTLEFLRLSLGGEWVKNPKGIRIRDKLHIEWGDRFEWPDSDAEIKGNRFFCYGLKDQFGILSDGTVVPCCLDSDGVIALGNIFEDDLNRVLKSKRAEDMVECFKRGEASEDLCKRCGYAQRFV